MTEQTQQMQTKKKASPLLLLALVGLLLTTLLLAYYPSLANAQQGSTTITGRIVEIADFPGASHAIMDEASGTRYFLISDSVDLQYYTVSEERVIVHGMPVPNQYTTDTILNVTQIQPAADGDEDPPVYCQSLDCPKPGNPADKATLSFELAVEGEPPAAAQFLGFTTLESVMTTPLSDPDGDDIYTGSMTVPKFAPGGPPEPISLSTVRIVQGPSTGSTANGPEYRVIKDFGSVKLDGDKTFKASVSFADDGGIVVCQSLDCPKLPDGDNGGGSDNNNGGTNNGGGSNNDGGSASGDGTGTSGGGSGGSDTNSGGSGSGGSDSSSSGDGSQTGGNPSESSAAGSSGILSGIGNLPGNLPSTGGSLLIMGLVGALLIVGGLITRRVFQ